MSATLAIVIPAYKARFLDATLQSIAAQDCRDFCVHVGDDASPDDLAAICSRWSGQFELRYTRFDDNLGGRDLVAQWQRCVALGSEPWVWLFSDDDLMPPDAVRRVLAAVQQLGTRQPLLHFNVEQIGAEGRLLRVEPPFPQQLSVREFALRRLRFTLSSFAPDYVFLRQAFEASGGFVPFPRAWCSDDATWINIAAGAGIHTLDGACVQWRLSGENISARHEADAVDKAWAQLRFLQWLEAFLLQHPAAPGEPSDAELQHAMRPWFFRQAKLLKLRFHPGPALAMLRALSQLRGQSSWRMALAMLRSDLRRRIIDGREARRARRRQQQR